MFRMDADGVVFHDLSKNDPARVAIGTEATLEFNQAGSLVFTLPPGNVVYKSLQKRKSVVTLYQDDEIIIRGRVLESVCDLENLNEVYCEGEMALLHDSQQPPVEFKGTAADYFRLMVSNHNAQMEADKQFVIGEVSAVTDEQTVDIDTTEYRETLDEMKSLLVEEFGGYLRVRYSGGVRYLDYIKQYTGSSGQKIQFGVNLVDIEKRNDTVNLCTVLIPIGKKGLTVEEANGGSIYIEDAQGIAEYGRIIKTKKFEKVEDAEELLSLGLQAMEQLKAERTITVKAVDMKIIDPAADSMTLGDRVWLESSPHGLNESEVCTKAVIKVDSPDQSEYTFGTPMETLTGATASLKKKTQSDYDKLKDWLTVTDTELTLAKQWISETGDVVSEVRLEMDSLNAEIKLIATQHSIDELVERVSKAEIEIDGIDAEIKLLATQNTIEGLVQRVTAAEIAVDGANAAIALKASQATVDELTERLSQAEINIDGANAQILLMATKEEIQDFGSRITNAEIAIDGANTQIGLWAGELDELGNRLDGAEILINGLESQIVLKADKSITNELDNRISSAEVQIDGAMAEIYLKADQSTVTALGKRLTQAEVDIDGANAQIKLMATKSELEDVDQRVSQAEIDIDAANAAISLKASTSSVTALTNRVSTAEADINAAEAAISLKASKSSVTALENRVTSAEIKLDGAESSIELLAEQIRLAGYVTMDEFEALEGQVSSLMGGLSSFTVVQAGAVNADSIVSTYLSAASIQFAGATVSQRSITMGGLTSAGKALTTGAIDLSHSHKVQVNSDGTITLGEVATSGGSFKIADTTYYKNGVSAAKDSVTLTNKGWQGGRVTVEASNGKSVTVSLPPFSVSGGDSFNSSHKTTVYFSTASVSGYLKSKEVDASSVYSSGVSSGKSAVTLSAAGWQGGSNVVSASNGKSVTVSLPPFSVSGGDSFNSSHKTTVYFSTASVSGYLKSKVVDATSVYNAGYTAGKASVDTQSYYDDGYAAGYQAAKDAVKVTAGISWSNPAQYYCMIRYWGKATIDGEEVGYASSSESRNIKGYC